ncbi:hypothetical protein FA13DRAFT_1717329 [Coprinellus micaceus]|uniref:Uncharacterized protein n=1 Tax=Coprinellus micaceus TaxID=71717 RepID=A0A4Y7SGS4_COPMI|nr:hypothetical protein FA13DRAFT_1717329 [Coprinellus micaceus]
MCLDAGLFIPWGWALIPRISSFYFALGGWDWDEHYPGAFIAVLSRDHRHIARDKVQLNEEVDNDQQVESTLQPLCESDPVRICVDADRVIDTETSSGGMGRQVFRDDRSAPAFKDTHIGDKDEGRHEVHGAPVTKGEMIPVQFKERATGRSALNRTETKSIVIGELRGSVPYVRT